MSGTGKPKNPKRVAAAKKAYAARMRGKGGRRGSTSTKTSRSSKPKKISLSKSIVFVGGAVVVTGLGRAQTQLFMGSINGFLADVGMAPITGAQLAAVAVVLSLVASTNAWFRAKYTAFLGKWGLRP